MIRLKLPAEMACDKDGCEKTLHVELVLTPAGGWGFKVGQLKTPWQVQMQRGNPMAPYSAFCPEHIPTIETPPLVNGRGSIITNAH